MNKIDEIPLSELKPYVSSFGKILGEKYSPFSNNGYMFEFKFETAKIIRDIYNKPFPDLC
jgi:hypothetical protein